MQYLLPSSDNPARNATFLLSLQARSETKPGTVGVKVSILSPYAILKDRIKVDEDLLKKIEENIRESKEEPKKTSGSSKTKKVKK